MSRGPDLFPEMRGRIFELRVLRRSDGSFLGEPLDGTGAQEITADGAFLLIEGEIACVAEEAPGTGRFELVGSRVDSSFLPGPRQSLEDRGNGDHEISSPAREDEDELDAALDAWRSGDHEGARVALLDLAGRVPRMIDAWHHLGIIEEQIGYPHRAAKYYLTGWEIGRASIPDGFTGRLPWGFVDNRPFLRAGHGLGLTRLRDGSAVAAADVFEQILRLNPEDNQGIRFLLAPLYLTEDVPDRARALFSVSPPDGMNLFVAALLEILSGHRRDAVRPFLAGTSLNPWAPLYLADLLDAEEDEEVAEHPECVAAGSPGEARDSLQEIRDLWDDAGGPAFFRVLIESEEFIVRYGRILDIARELPNLPVGEERSALVGERYALLGDEGIQAVLRDLAGRL